MLSSSILVRSKLFDQHALKSDQYNLVKWVMTSPFHLSVAWLLEERVCSEGRDLVFFNVPLLR